MAAIASPAAVAGSLHSCFHPAGTESIRGHRRGGLRLRCAHQAQRNSSAGRLRASSGAAVVETVELDSEPKLPGVEKEKDAKEELLACPICFQPLIRKGPSGNKQKALIRSGFQCTRCRKAYSTRDVFLDLTVVNGAREYEETFWQGTELFRSPVVSYVYERGWRQNFRTAGFPGPDEEFKMAQEYLKPTLGGVLVDVSCGSGLFSRRFAQSGLYKTVIALDYSENMLRQTSELIKQDSSLADADIVLVRADVGRLPFATGSVDAIHAGAAIHCWPSPSTGVAEISRVLRPGGVFVASTFTMPPSLIKPVRQAISGVFRQVGLSSSMRYWEKSELADLCRLCGLQEYRETTRERFIMFTARKAQQ